MYSAGPKEKASQSKISEFLQEMQQLGIGDSAATAPLQPTATPTTSSGPHKEASGETSKTEETVSRDQADERLAGEDRMSKLSPKEKSLMAEWVPLGLNFGIPLFSQEANNSVCEKVSLALVLHLHLWHNWGVLDFLLGSIFFFIL